MELTVCNSGLKVITKEQGLTEYRAHRITYNISPEQYPKLFVWVYKHEGKKLKVCSHSLVCFSFVLNFTIDRITRDSRPVHTYATYVTSFDLSSTITVTVQP